MIFNKTRPRERGVVLASLMNKQVENHVQSCAQFLRENMEKHIDYLTKEIQWTEHTSEERFYEQQILDKEERELLFEVGYRKRLRR